MKKLFYILILAIIVGCCNTGCGSGGNVEWKTYDEQLELFKIMCTDHGTAYELYFETKTLMCTDGTIVDWGAYDEQYIEIFY